MQQTPQESHLSHKAQNNNVIVKLKDPGIPSTHFPWHPHTIKCRGQWYWNKERQFHSCAHTKSKWPKLLFQSEALFVPNIQMQQLFFSPFSYFFFFKWLWTPPSHFPFLQYFHFIKLQSMCFVCSEKGMAHSVVVSATAYIGGSSSLRIRSLCVMKGYEKSVI